MYDRRAAALDYVGGVFCAQEKLKFFTSQNLPEDSSRDDSAAQEKDTLFTIALELLSYVANASSEENNEQHERESSVWLPLLCHVTNTSKSPSYRTLVERALKHFCGEKIEIYQSIQDHYIVAFQFRKLLQAVLPALEAGLIVKEQARQCGINWQTGRKATFTSLPVGSLIGTNDLISEDCVMISRGKMIGSMLDQLLSIAKIQGNNWRNFCGLETLPSQSIKKKCCTDTEIDSALQTVSPVISLIWIASVLLSKNQIQILRLIDIALSTQPPRKLSGSAEKVLSPVLESSRFKALLSFCIPSSFPEDLLLEGNKALLADELHAFAIQFVIDGNNAELQKGAAKVVKKLCKKFEDDNFVQFTNRAFSGLPELGANFNELLRLLQTLAASNIHRISPFPLLSISRNVIDIFPSQFRYMSRGKSTVPQQGDKVLKGPSEEDYDFKSWVHCQRARTAQETMLTLMTLDGLFIDELGQWTKGFIAGIDIILRCIRGSNAFLGGVLVFATMDWKQLKPMSGLHAMLSPSMITSFTFLDLGHSVRREETCLERVQHCCSQMLGPHSCSRKDWYCIVHFKCE
jgi:hypothetical protein